MVCSLKEIWFLFTVLIIVIIIIIITVVVVVAIISFLKHQDTQKVK